jgi:O-antigen/teichoic acid export membrane protein
MKSLIRNSGLNLLGSALPQVVALVTIPIVLRAYGPERFAILALVQLVLGFSGLFDLGMGRAIASRVSASRANESSSRLLQVAILISIVIGLLALVSVLFAAKPLAEFLVKKSPSLRGEAQGALVFVGLALPAVILSSIFVGFLDAHDRFGKTNALQGVATVLANIAPVFLASLSLRMDLVIAVLAGLRIAQALALGSEVAAILGFRAMTPGWCKEEAMHLGSFGGWISTSNALGPILAGADRAVLAGVRPLAEVAAYSVPLAVASRLNVIPYSVTRSLFPYVGSRGPGADGWTATLAAFRWIAAAVGLLTVILITFGRELLGLWLGQAPLVGSPGVLLGILALGALFNCLAYCPLTYLQASGKPDLSAKLHLVEACV